MRIISFTFFLFFFVKRIVAGFFCRGSLFLGLGLFWFNGGCFVVCWFVVVLGLVMLFLVGLCVFVVQVVLGLGLLCFWVCFGFGYVVFWVVVGVCFVLCMFVLCVRVYILFCCIVYQAIICPEMDIL